MAETVKKIVLHAQEVKKDKQNFIACSAEINGKWYKIKFTKDCEGAPKKKGLYELVIDFDECSIEKGKRVVTSKGNEITTNTTIWVRFITGIRQFTEEELKQSNRIAMADIFGE